MTGKLTVIALLIAIVLGLLPSTITFAQDDPITLPEPTGPYQVGQTEIHLIDESRPETFTDDPDDVRELLLTVFYPAEPAPDAQPALYIANDAVRRLMEEEASQPGALDAFYAHSYLDAPLAIADAPYPVLILNPGFIGPPLFNTIMAENLASHGYIVVGIWHPYSTNVTVFPDGRMAEGNPAGQSRGNIPAIMDVWRADSAFVLDQLDTLNTGDSLLANSMDLARMGTLGWSFGGAAAFYMLQQNDHLLAGAMLDYTRFPDMQEGLQQPALFMLSWGDRYSSGTLGTMVEQGYVLALEGSVHETFSDLPFLVPALGLPAPPSMSIEANRAAAIVNAYLLAFFDTHIKGEESPLLAGPSPDYEDVLFDVYGPD